jgi:phenylacetate-coenzyme A ligase PaaK-like adenylate-forming protein
MTSWRLPPADLFKLQSKKLRRIMRYAEEYVPYYHSLFRSIGMEPEEFGDPQRLRSLPFLSKQAIVQNAGLLVAGDASRAITRLSTGTTGRPVRILWSREYTQVRNALHLRAMTHAGMRPWHKVVTIWPPTSTWRRAKGRDGVERPSTAMMEVSASVHLPRIISPFVPLWSDPASPPRDARALARQRPDFVISTPSRLTRIGKAAVENGISLRPRALVVANEIVTKSTKTRLGELFDCQVIIWYGCTEFGPLGCECTHAEGIHLSEDQMVYEVVRDGEAVGPGEKGELVVTSVHNKTMPLFRYRTGDIVRRSDSGVCGCGSWLARISEVHGRADDGLLTLEGTRVTSLEAAQVVEASLGVDDYKLVQLAIDRFSVKVSPSEMIGNDALSNLRIGLQGILGVSPSIELVEGSEDDFVGKNRPIVSLVR